MPRISAEQLCKLQKKHVTDEAIGAIFGITRQAVHRLRQAYGIPPVEERHGRRNAEILRLYRKGASGIAIAKQYGISISQCFRVLGGSRKKARKK